jgi:glucose-1-phosphate thymidylyltransferase
VGLVPAAGTAERLSPLPCSKEILPIGFQTVRTPDGERHLPRVACQHLLEQMRRAGVREVYLVLRSGKWDIPAYLGDGRAVGLHIAYLIMGEPHGVPYTLSQALPFLGTASVLVGFPDTLYDPPDAFGSLSEALVQTPADLVLGLFPAERPDKMDMVDLGPGGEVRDIVIKPHATDLRWAWSMAAWGPVFTEFLRDFVAVAPVPFVTDEEPEGRELHLGDVVRGAVSGGLRIESVLFPHGRCVDIGTADDLKRILCGDPFEARKTERDT